MDSTERKYLIYAFTYKGALTQIFIGMLIPLLTFLIVRPDFNVTAFLIILAFFNVLIWYLVKEYLLQPIEFVLTEDRVKLFYYNSKLTKKKKAKAVLTDKISRFSDFSNARDLKFKLYFKTGETFTLYKSGLWNKKDDFELLIRDFNIYIENYNIKGESPEKNSVSQKIKYGDNTYLTFAIILLIPAIWIGILFVDSIISENAVDNKKLFGFLMLLVLGLVNLSLHRKSKQKR